eukprot:gene31756-6954_t
MARSSGILQFKAVVRKNIILQTRSRSTIVGGWAVLVFQILTPVAFFALMCIPTYYIKPISHEPIWEAATRDLESRWWSGPDPYSGPAANVSTSGGLASIILVPDTARVRRLAHVLALALACPEDPDKRICPPNMPPNNYHCMFLVSTSGPQCKDAATCMSDSSCYSHVVERQLMGPYLLWMRDTPPKLPDFNLLITEAAQLMSESFATNVDAATCMSDSSCYSHVVERQLMVLPSFATYNMNTFSPVPLMRATCSQDAATCMSDSSCYSHVVYAYLSPSRAMVLDVVREKELRLREGMCMLGLTDFAYWSSWAITHFSVLMASSTLCALVCLYPFRGSALSILIVFFALFSASLVSFSYFLSTLFSASRVAGSAVPLLYALAMIPGFLAPSIQQYGGSLWYWSCLLPPSAASQFASAMVNWELVGAGINYQTISLPAGQVLGSGSGISGQNSCLKRFERQ